MVDEDAAGHDRIVEDSTVLPYPFRTAKELLAHCSEQHLSISQVMLANEAAWRPEGQTRARLLHIWQVMQDCVEAGCRHEGILPGGLKVKRRAPALYRQLSRHPEANLRDALSVLDWVNLYALAVNEENAYGGRVVTAPTNGAAGIVPAVLHYYMRFVPGASEDGVVRFCSPPPPSASLPASGRHYPSMPHPPQQAQAGQQHQPTEAAQGRAGQVQQAFGHALPGERGDEQEQAFQHRDQADSGNRSSWGTPEKARGPAYGRAPWGTALRPQRSFFRYCRNGSFLSSTITPLPSVMEPR